MNENEQIENSEEAESDFRNKRMIDNNEYQFRNKTNYRDNNKINKEFYSMRNKDNKNVGNNIDSGNYNKIYKNVEIREDYYNSALN